MAPSTMKMNDASAAAPLLNGKGHNGPSAKDTAQQLAANDYQEKLVWYEHLLTGVGATLLLMVLPPVAMIVGSAVLWDALDRGFGGKPLDGLSMSFARWFNKVTAPFHSRWVKHKEDAFIMNTLFLLGVVIPATFLLSAYITVQRGSIHWGLLFAYHLFRIGPYFMNFAYAYTLSHKEGHNRQGFYTSGNFVLRYAFNWWIGLFYGMMPSFFTYGHSVNHHMYNNGPLDVVSTADKRRDSFYNWMGYLPRWFMFHVNISSMMQFLSEGKNSTALKMILGTCYWAAFAYLWAVLVSPAFAILYLVVPLMEAGFLLSCVNWTWHAFICPEDPEDDYVGSVTIFDGPINVMHEDYHVVHHQYPGVHWTRHPALYEKHLKRGEYAAHKATCFKHTHVFELFFMIVLRDWEALADRYVDLSNTMNREQIIQALKARTRSIWWGPRRPAHVTLKGTEVGHFMEGGGKKAD